MRRARRQPRMGVAWPRATKSSHPVVASSGGTGEEDGVLEVGQLLRGASEQCWVVGIEEPTHGQKDPGPTAGEDVCRLHAAEPRVDGHEHATCCRHPQRGDDPFEGVWSPHRDAVTGFDAQGQQRPGSVVDHARELGEADPSPTVHDRFGAAELTCGIADHGGNCWPGDLAAHVCPPFSAGMPVLPRGIS